MRKLIQTTKVLLLFSAGILTIKNIINRDLAYTLVALSLFIITFIPEILRKIGLKFNNGLELVFLLFIFLAQVLGSLLNFYDYIYLYDKVVHFFSGILTAFIGLYLLNIFKCKTKNIIFVSIFTLFTSLSIATLWEVFEYVSNMIFGGDPQNVFKTGVNDTMLDIIVALIASIIIIIIYIYEEKANKKSIIKNLIRDNN